MAQRFVPLRVLHHGQPLVLVRQAVGAAADDELHLPPGKLLLALLEHLGVSKVWVGKKGVCVGEGEVR